MANQVREGKAKTWLPRGILISGHGSFQGDLYLTLEQQLFLPSAPLAPPSSRSFLQTIPYYTVGFMSTPQVLPNDLSFYAGPLSDSTLVTKPSVVSAGLENEVSPLRSPVWPCPDSLSQACPGQGSLRTASSEASCVCSLKFPFIMLFLRSECPSPSPAS